MFFFFALFVVVEFFDYYCYKVFGGLIVVWIIYRDQGFFDMVGLFFVVVVFDIFS